MHEFSIAMNIIDLVNEEVARASGGVVSEIEIEVGLASGVVREALEFALESAVKETPLENTKIIIVEVPAIAECLACKNKFSIQGTLGSCPECGDITANLVSGRELRVKSITLN